MKKGKNYQRTVDVIMKLDVATELCLVNLRN